MAIRAVLFDLGETLFNYGDVSIDHIFRQAARATYDYLCGLAGAEHRLGAFWRYHRRQSISIKWHWFWSNILRREFDCLALLDKRSRAMGLRLTAAQLQELACLWYRPLGDIATLEPDLHGTLTQLQDMSLKLAIISNTFLPGFVLDRQLEHFDLLRFFPVRVYSSDTVYRKPDGRIYRCALEKINVPAAAAMMVGDKVREDVTGPAKLGITGVLKRTFANAKHSPDNAATITAIAELPGLIASEKNLNRVS